MYNEMAYVLQNQDEYKLTGASLHIFIIKFQVEGLCWQLKYDLRLGLS